jgi:hypothetical protein
MGLLTRFRPQTEVVTLESERASLRVAERDYRDNALWLTERLAELELALEDRGWQQLTGDSSNEFTREGLKRICALSRLMYLKNPLINRAVSLGASYVFGQGIVIQSEDEATNTIIQAFMDDAGNKAELTSHSARMLKDVDLTVLGNIFFVLFKQEITGAIKVRSIPVDEITEIMCNPEDMREVWYYKRVWNQKVINEDGTYGAAESREAYYPDYRYTEEGETRRMTIGGKPVMWDSPVYHLKTGGMSDMKFGVPETYSGLDWAGAYKNFLEDWATIARSLSKFAWNMTTPNGNRGVQAAKTKLNSLLGRAGAATEANPPPVAGSLFIGSNGQSMEPMKIGGANISAEDGRRLLLMVAAGTGFPETFFGDASVGTLATAKSLDRPTELKMIDRRTVWGDVFKEIIGYALGKNVANGFEVGDKAAKIDVDWPPLLEHSVGEQVDAIIAAATLDGKRPSGSIDFETMARLLLTALGYDDIDEELAKHPPKFLEPPVAAAPGVGGPDNQPNNPNPSTQPPAGGPPGGPEDV